MILLLTGRHLRNRYLSLVRKAKSTYFPNCVFENRGNPLLESSQVMTASGPIIDQIEMCGAFNNHFASAGHIFEIVVSENSSNSSRESFYSP